MVYRRSHKNHNSKTWLAVFFLLTLSVFASIPSEGCSQPSSSMFPSEDYASLPYSPKEEGETIMLEYGRRMVRAPKDKRISQKDLKRSVKRCFIVVSKKDYYLYVYEPQGRDTVLLARYDIAVARMRGQKRIADDFRTPHGLFRVTKIEDATQWCHDFSDGRGELPSYGSYFLRLNVAGFKGIGIHGSTNNDASVPGRASEGCIRLHDADVKDLAEHYAYVGMKVLIKADLVDDLPFEIRAHRRQQIPRRRHYRPSASLTNETVSMSWALPGQGTLDSNILQHEDMYGILLLWPLKDDFGTIMNKYNVTTQNIR